MQVDLRRAHGKIWPVLVLVLAVLFGLALAFKPEVPVERTPLPALSQSDVPDLQPDGAS